MAKPNPMGSTFAERAAALKGESSFTDPTPKSSEAVKNDTFAERAKAAGKQVKSDAAEDKAVKSSKAAKKS